MIDIFLISTTTKRRELLILKKAMPQKIIFSREAILKKMSNKNVDLGGSRL